jgi:hypothetical protein
MGVNAVSDDEGEADDGLSGIGDEIQQQQCMAPTNSDRSSSYQADYNTAIQPEWEQELNEYLRSPPPPELPSWRNLRLSEMTPDKFRLVLLPHILAAWEGHCFCANPAYQKLLSFNFDDYRIGPAALVDAEILIEELVRKKFDPRGQPTERRPDWIQTYACPKCGATCNVLYAEYSIHVSRSVVIHESQFQPASEGLYVLGFFGHVTLPELKRIKDFRFALTVEEFMDQFAAPDAVVRPLSWLRRFFKPRQ